MADLEIEFLYLNLTSCARCTASDQKLREALAAVAPALEAIDAKANLRKVRVESAQQALELRLVSSPTIRVNGSDIAGQLHETSCADCGELCGRDTIDCRAWAYKGQVYDEAPVGLIVEALLREALDARHLPVNLQRFFSAEINR